VGIVDNKMKNHLKKYRLLVEIWTNITSDQNTSDANNIKTLKAEDAPHGTLEDERFALIPLHESRLSSGEDFSPGSKKLLKKDYYLLLFFPNHPAPLYPKDRYDLQETSKKMDNIRHDTGKERDK
jgi:hypothetical protein